MLLMPVTQMARPSSSPQVHLCPCTLVRAFLRAAPD